MNRILIIFLVPIFYLIPVCGEESLWHQSFEWNEETGLPEGVELATITDEEIEEAEEEECHFNDSQWEELFGNSEKSCNASRVPFGDDLFQEPTQESNTALATLQSGPSAIVGQCVNAITGDFFDAQMDLVVPGPIPLVVQRTYCSSEGKWHFRHMPKLKVGLSKGKNHLWAGYYDDTGSGMLYRSVVRHHHNTAECAIPESVFRKGLTNAGSDDISGQTNWRNTLISFVRIEKKKNKKVEEEKAYLLRHGTRVLRYFTRYKRVGDQHKKGAPLGKFHLDSEVHPNGNQLTYDYEGDFLTSLKGKNKHGVLFSTLDIAKGKEGKVIWKAKNGSVDYYFDSDEKKLLAALPSHGVRTFYKYLKDQIVEKILPNNRILRIEYEKDKVSKLLAPVGPDNTLQPIFTFNYHDNSTSVRDAKNNLTTYFYDFKTKRLSAIHRYDGKIPHSKEYFVWDDQAHVGNLLSRTFTGKGDVSFRHEFTYDAKDNIQKELLIGNLTGKGNEEVYQKHYIYSQCPLNLLLYEQDERKWITYSYAPNTNCLTQRLTKNSAGKIIKREFFEYDANGTVVKEIWDDGVNEKKDDLQGVTERHIKIIQPTSQFPVGLPETITEGYWNKNKEDFFKRVENKYNLSGQLIEQKHYSGSTVAYTLYWEYDALGNILKQINALGEETHYQYDANGNKIYEKTPTVEKFFTYDCANRLVKEEEKWADQTFTLTHCYNTLNQRIATLDIYGNETTYEYDLVGKVTKKISPQGVTEITDYDALGNVISHTDANGFTTKKAYTIRGQPYRIEYPDGSIETKEYSRDGLLVKEISKTGLTTSYTHDAWGHVIRTEVYEGTNLLKVTSATYNAFHMLSETDEMGLVTTYDYDGAGRCIKKTTGDHVTQYYYDSLGRLTNTKTQQKVITHEYDNLNRVIEERLTDLEQIFKKEQYRYDTNGNRTHVIAFTQAGVATTVTEYNPRNQVTKVTDALGNDTHTTYNYNHLENGQTVLQITQTDPLGNQEIKTHDTLGRVASLAHRNSLNELTQQEVYQYDAKGQRLAVTITLLPQEKTVTNTWEYDSMGNCTRSIEAKGTSEQKETTYFYNSSGHKERTIQPNGVTLFYTYNPLGLLHELKSSDQTIHYIYTYDLKEHPTHIKDLIHHTENTRTYDTHYRLISETLDTGHTLSYTYDPLDRLHTLTLPDHTSITYHHHAHFLTSIDRLKEGKVLYTHRYHYDLAGQVIRKELIGQAGQIEHTHDLLGRTISLNTPHWKETIPQDGYDAAGNLLKRHIIDAQGQVTYTYTYDDLYQLTSEKGDAPHFYKNDSLFNRTNKDDQPYQFNSLNQLLAQTDLEYQYDPNGNLIKTIQGNQITEYRYDAFNRLISIKKNNHLTTYRYDSFHRRISKDDIHYLYQGENEIGSIQGNKITELRVLGLGHGAEIGAAIFIELQGVPYVPIHDPYGNLVMLLDLKGKPIESYRYTAFGESTSTTKINNPWKFSSKRYDPESGFYYFGRRYYSPDIGRWITPDPIGFEDGFNLYAYVLNHPLTYIDPDGQLIQFVVAGVLGLAVTMGSSMAADYFIASSLVVLEQYAEGTIAAGFVKGLSMGYNGSLFDLPLLLDPALPRDLRAGLASGLSYNFLPNPRNFKRCGTYLVNNAGNMSVSGSLAYLKKSVTSWSSQKSVRETLTSTIDKTAKVTEKQIANNGKKIGNAAEELTKKGRNRFSPDLRATGEHTVFRRGPNGKITHYETFRPQTNPFDPKPWESLKRYDSSSNMHYHFNKVTRERIWTPHVHDPYTPGEIRMPDLWEIPK